MSSVIDEVAPLQEEENGGVVGFTLVVADEKEVAAGVGSLKRNPAMTVVIVDDESDLHPNIDKDSWFKPSLPQINILKAPNKIGAGRKVELLHAKAYHHLSLSKYCC